MGNLVRPTIFIAATLIFFFHSATAQELWQGTKSGMSISEVLKTVPGTSRINDGASLGNGARELVRLPRIVIVGENFRVRFYFQNEKLTQVTLSLEREQPFASLQPIYESLVVALRAKYGKEIGNKNDIGRIMRILSSDWYHNGVNINLLAVAVGNSPGLINVNYQTRVAGDAGRL